MRVRLITAMVLATAAAAALGAGGGQAAESGDGEVVLTSTGGEQTFTVPEGVRALWVEAVGGHGASTLSQGGRGALVSGTLEVQPGDVLYVNVGGSGNGPAGGFNGGGNGGDPSDSPSGGGGGGATDIRTVPRASTSSAAQILVIAAGGGGAGANSGIAAGGAGGDAGGNGGDGSGPLRGTGGKSGTTAGTAGSSGSDPGNTCETSLPSTGGSAPLDGRGGRGAEGDCGTGSGGGGGGGFFGGGGGGAGAIETFLGDPIGTTAGGGGGGGGSSRVPTGFTQGLAQLSTEPHVRFTWTLPETRIAAGPRGRIATRKKRVRKRFRFAGEGANVAGFECRLDGKAFKPCTSPKRVTLKRGRHTFAVRAIQADGNYDVTPAKRTVRVVKKKRRKR